MNLQEAQGFIEAVEAWRTFPSDYEYALLDKWLKSHIDGAHDYEAHLALAVLAQRNMLARSVVEGDDIGKCLEHNWPVPQGYTQCPMHHDKRPECRIVPRRLVEWEDTE